MMRKWEPEQAFRLIEREKINLAGGVPTIAWQILEHPARENYDLSSLETVAYGGAPSAPELVRQIKEVFPEVAARQRLGHDRDLAPPSPSTAARTTRTVPTAAAWPPPVGEMKIVAQPTARACRPARSASCGRGARTW